MNFFLQRIQKKKKKFFFERGGGGGGGGGGVGEGAIVSDFFFIRIQS